MQNAIEILERVIADIEREANSKGRKYPASEERCKRKKTVSEDSIEERLYSYHSLIGSSEKSDELYSILKSSIHSKSNVDTVRQKAIGFNNETFGQTVLLFSPFWLRDPDEWCSSDERSFLEHVFVEYDPPRALVNAWFVFWPENQYKWNIWYLILAQGGSLKKAGKYFGWFIQSKFQYCLYLVENEFYGGLPVCIASEIMRLGGTIRHLYRITAIPAYTIDPTDKKLDMRFLAFWKQTVTWMIHNGHLFNDAQYDEILRWALDKFRDAGLKGRNFSWKGRTCSNVLKRSHEFSKKNKKHSTSEWTHHKLDWICCDDMERIWTVTELTNRNDLNNEGSIMMHCVGNYTQKCASYIVAIFSLECNQEKRATIEYDFRYKKITEARGPDNRELFREEKRMIDSWAEFVEKGGLVRY